MADSQQRNDPKEKRPQRKGIANPGPLRDPLEAIDTAIVEMSALRNDMTQSVEDAFTPLRSSAQIFREIFWGVELPIKTPHDLLERAGGPTRLITATYRETGPLVLALGDIVEAIPKFKSVFPITNFQEFAVQIEQIREDDGQDTGTGWFVTRVGKKFLAEALKNRKSATDLSVLSRPRASLTSCTQCGARHSPAAVLISAFRDLQITVGAERWTGKPVRRGEE